MALPTRALVLLLSLALACGDDDGDASSGDTVAGDAAVSDAGTGDAGADDGGARPPSSIGPDDRPAGLRLPGGYSPEGSYPLVVLLHGYGASGFIQEAYFGIRALARDKGFIAVIPDGTEDSGGSRFWNATDACCDFGATGVDDVAYITGLIDEALEVTAADPDRVYLLGHSNGGFMSYRMACEVPEKITAIASLAGATWLDPDRCGSPSEPTSVLQIHGTLDTTILYEGAVGYPSARTSVDRFAERAGCAIETTTTGERLDFDSNVPGADTARVETTADCAAGTSFALWSIEGGGHIPTPADGAIGAVIDWLLTHEG